MDELDRYDYDAADDTPGPDEPDERLHFDELHQLIQDAARDAWVARDYHEAVIAGWNSLRDRLRDRLTSNADGIELINLIGGESDAGPPPRLPLTDYDSPTTRGMHRGLVKLLRGIVGYVRNPEQHEESYVRDDKVGAFERLALMSMCARRVDIRTHPIRVDDALDELRQERFSDTPEARAELIAAVPAAEHPDFARALAETARGADDEGYDELATRCRTTHRDLTLLLAERNRQHVLSQIARDIDRLVSRDETLDLAIRLLTPPVFVRLAGRNQEKVADRILEDVQTGARTTRPQRGAFHRDAPRIFPALPPDERREFLRLVEVALRDDDPQRRTYGTWTAAWVSRHLNDDETTRLAHAVVETIVEGRSEIVAELERRRRTASYAFRSALRELLAEVGPETAEAEAAVKAVLEIFPPPRVRRVRSVEERPR